MGVKISLHHPQPLNRPVLHDACCPCQQLLLGVGVPDAAVSHDGNYALQQLLQAVALKLMNGMMEGRVITASSLIPLRASEAYLVRLRKGLIQGPVRR